MKIISIKCIGNDYGGNNLLFTIHIDKEQVDINYIEEKLYIFNKPNNNNLFEWDYTISYDNMDYNGLFFTTIFIDKDNLNHTIDNGKVTITDNFICDLILDDCKSLIEFLNNFKNTHRIQYQRILWNYINYEDDIYEQFIDNEEVNDNEIKDLEDLAKQEISIKEFAIKQGYEW